MLKPKKSILVVDDSSQDTALLREAFREAGCQAPVIESGSVDDAISFFEAKGPHAGAEPPSLVLLDLQMPLKNGFEFLNWLRARPEPWHRVPVIMLTTSHDYVEINKAYDLGANSFLVKPTDFTELVGAAREIMAYWLERNRVS